MTKVYLLVSFGRDYDDEYEDDWENVEAVFSSYSAMTTWINVKFEQVESEFLSSVLPTIPVFDEVYLSGSFKCSEHNEVVGLRYKAYDVIGEVDCKTDKIMFKEN